MSSNTRVRVCWVIKYVSEDDVCYLTKKHEVSNSISDALRFDIKSDADYTSESNSVTDIMTLKGYEVIIERLVK